MFSSKEEKEPKPSSLKFAISSESENILTKLLKVLRHDLFPKTTSITPIQDLNKFVLIYKLTI